MTTAAQAETSRTAAQAEASRVNGAKSRGPATPEGKERSRWNALRHGLAAEKVVVLGEDAAAFEEYRQAFFDDERPQGAIEASLVERLAVLNWRLRRAVELETGLVNIGRWRTHVKECERLKRPCGATDADWRPARQSTVGYVMEDELRGPNSKYDTAGRYERRLERGVFQTLRELRELRKERRGLPGRSAAKPGDAEREDAEKEERTPPATFSAIQTEAPAPQGSRDAGDRREERGDAGRGDAEKEKTQPTTFSREPEASAYASNTANSQLAAQMSATRLAAAALKALAPDGAAKDASHDRPTDPPAGA